MNCLSKILTAVAIVAGPFFLLAPSARADIFEIESATPCGGTICNAGSPFSNLGGLSIGSGTQKYLITDNTGTFSFIFTGSAGDNGSCQINGGAASFFSGCTGSNSNATGFSNGHDLTGGNGTFPPTVLTFTATPGAFSSCSALNPCNFTFGFVSMQGTGVTAVPEPTTFVLLGLGLGLAYLVQRSRLRLR